MTRYWYRLLPFLLKNESFIRDYNRDFNFECGIVVYSVEKSYLLIDDTFRSDLDLKLSKSVLEFFNIHI